jgi:cyclic pyranopterin phosphate synthase
MIEKRIDYLRISVTDRCNLRCIYCMPPQGISTVSQRELLSFEEIVRLVGIFSRLGIRRVRLTGGEPLLRKDLSELVKRLAGIKQIEEFSLTTNGILLSRHASQLKQAGLSGVNVSLDTLNRDRFKTIARRDAFDAVWAGIRQARQEGLKLKLNVVLMKGINDGEIPDFIRFAWDNEIVLRFIEFMNITPLWRKELFLPMDIVLEDYLKNFRMEKLGRLGAGPAIYYKIEGKVLIGLIRTDKSNCSICNRLRLSSTGRLMNCLYENGGISLRELLRSGAGDDEIERAIKSHLVLKGRVNYSYWHLPQFYMCNVGG